MFVTMAALQSITIVLIYWDMDFYLALTCLEFFKKNGGSSEGKDRVQRNAVLTIKGQ